MKKKVLAVLFAVCITFALVACEEADVSDGENDVEEFDDEDGSDDEDMSDDEDTSDEEEEEEETEKLGSQDKSLLKPFLGRWAYENKDVHITMGADFSWVMYNFIPDEGNGTLEKISSGTFNVDEENVYFYDKNDKFVMQIEYISMNNLKDDQGEELLRYISPN